jgi:hypothetical protein
MSPTPELIFTMLTILGVALVAGGRLTEFPRDTVASTLVFPTTLDAKGVPPTVHGLWWMRGNPAPDYVLSFGEGLCTNATYCEINVFEAGMWSWHNSVAGRVLHAIAHSLRAYYAFHFNADQTVAHVVPHSRLLGVGVPSELVAFDMYLDLELNGNGHIWVRNSTVWGGASHHYLLTRIIDAEKTPTTYFPRYQAETDATHLVFVRRHTDPGKQSLSTPPVCTL